jgi:Beta-propeller repeat/Viral BACON domain
VDSQGSAYLAGLRQSLSGSEVAYVYKLNPTGTGFVYSALVGGAGDSTSGATSIAVDTAGRAYVAGYTGATDFPTTPNAFQNLYPTYPNSKPAFVFGLNPSGTAFVYSTFLGGNYFDFATGIAIDNAGSAYVTGHTSSTAFPTTPGALNTSSLSYQTAFVTKLNASGTALLYSTYLGGSGQMNGGTHDAGAAIAVNSAGNAYVVGSTTSPDFPLTPGAFETTSTSIFTGAGFITKLNPSGSAAIYSTLIGGNSVSATGIALDASGNAYVSGSLPVLDFVSASSIGPQGYGEAFVLKLNASGSAPVYMTKFGGSFQDQANAIAVDSTGAAYFTGFTESSDFPVQVPVQAVKALEDNLTKGAFVAKLDAGGALAYSTYLGGQNNGDWGMGIAVGPDQTAYVTGRAGSIRFPITPGAIGDSSGSGFDTFVSAISTASSCTFAASPLTNAAPSGGGPGSIDITSQSGCNWVAVANRPWITLGGNANGSGSGQLVYSVTPSTSAARTGQISVAGLRVDVMQASGCIYSLDVNNVLEGPGGGLVVINNSASDSACPWTVSPVPPWIQMPASFQGSFTVLSNPSGVPPSARFTISGQPFVVNQTTSCGFATLSNPPKFSAQAGIGAVNFSVNSSCSWTAVSNAPWLHISSFDSSLGNDPLFGNGPGKLNFAIDANLSTAARSAALKIGGDANGNRIFDGTGSGQDLALPAISPW